MYDGAYVLGALSPPERAAFEGHLRQCDRCARSVKDLSGLPELLGRAAQADVPDSGYASAPPPPDLLPALLARARRERRRRRLLAGVGSAGVVLAACLTLMFTLLLPGAGEEAPDGTAMKVLGEYPVGATVSVAEAEWGTRVEVSCDYGGDRAGDYVLVAVARGGAVEELASWMAIPRNTASMTVGTPLRRDDIRSLEVRTTTGRPVLRMAMQ